MKTRPSRLAPLAAALILSGLAAPVAAADDAARIQELERKLERSLKMIEALADKVRQLEQAGATPSAGAQQNPRLDELQKQVGDLTAASSRRIADDGLPVHGFADVGIGRSTEDNIDRNGNLRQGSKGFSVGTLDLYLTPRFGDHMKSLIELAFEVHEDGDLEADLERAQIGYTFSDAATVWIGRFHTPYGYWNTAFHHGMQIQTSVMRPKFLDFEDKGGILPAHTTGVWVNGSLPFGGNKIGYDVFVGNSPSIRVDNGKLAGSLNMKMAGSGSHASSAGFNLSLRTGAFPDLTVGVHGLRAARVVDTAANSATRLGAYGGYAVFNNDNWELMSEVYRFHNRDLSGATGSHRSSAWYAQAGYTIGLLTPYARFEKANLDQHDNYFLAQESGRSYSRTALGARYELNPKAALKFELNRTRQDDTGGPGLSLRDSYTEARLQYAIRF